MQQKKHKKKKQPKKNQKPKKKKKKKNKQTPGSIGKHIKGGRKLQGCSTTVSEKLNHLHSSWGFLPIHIEEPVGPNNGSSGKPLRSKVKNKGEGKKPPVSGRGPTILLPEWDIWVLHGGF